MSIYLVTNATNILPIVYHLTGFGGDYRTYSQTDKEVMDAMLAANQVVPMIIVTTRSKLSSVRWKLLGRLNTQRIF